MNEYVNNESVFSGPVLITIVGGDEEAGRRYEQEGRALLAQVLTINGVNERIAAGEPGGFYFSSAYFPDGTRVTAHTNNGLNSIDIFPIAVTTQQNTTERKVEEIEEIIPCARAGVRYYSAATQTRDGQPGAYYSYRAPIVNPTPADYHVEEGNFPSGMGVSYFNPCFYVNPYIDQNISNEGGGYFGGYGFSCNYENVVVNIPATDPTNFTPETPIRLVAAGKFAYGFADTAGNSRVVLVNNDEKFSVAATLSFTAGTRAEIGWPNPQSGFQDAFQVPARSVNGPLAQTAAPISLLLADIEYVTSPATYTNAPPTPSQFRYSPELGNAAEPIDFSGDRVLFVGGFGGAELVTQYGKWRIASGVVRSEPFDMDVDAPATSWPFAGDEEASYEAAIIAHDMACDCIVGIAVKTLDAVPDGLFSFFVVNTTTGVADVLADLDIARADFLPGTEPRMIVGLVRTMLAGEGVAVVSFGSTYEERGIGANRIAVIEYCAPDDEGIKTTTEVINEYVNGALVNTSRLPTDK